MKKFYTFALLLFIAITANAGNMQLHPHSFKTATRGSGGYTASLMNTYTAYPHKAVAQNESTAMESEDGSAAPTLCGIVLNGTPTCYVVSFPAEPGANLTNVFANENLSANGQAIYADGLLYVQQLTSSSIGMSSTVQYVYDTKTWKLIDIREGLDKYSSAVSMAYDQTTGTAYGYFFDDDSSGQGQMFTFGTMNLATGETSPHRGVLENELVMAMAASPDGRLYGVTTNGLFVEINKETGEQTSIGHTDIHPQYMQSATIDQQTGKFYWAAFDDLDQSALYEIDITTGKPTLITSFPGKEEIVGLYVQPGEALPGAPMPPTDLGFDFSNDNLSGNITFTMPSLTVDGYSLSGMLKAKVTIDNNAYSVNAYAGETCSVPIQVGKAGIYLLTVSVENGTGTSDAAKAQKWIGPDIPTAVSNLTLAKEGNMAILTWEAPTTGIHGGYINPAELTYTITQTAGAGSFYEEHYTDTRIEIDFTGKVADGVQYAVQAFYKGDRGDTAYSNKVSFTASSYDVPFTLDFSDNFGLCTVVDANNDGITWAMSFKGLQITDSQNGAQDDWLILPAFNLKSGEMYEVTVAAKAKLGMLNPEKFEIRMGQGTAPEDMTTLLSTETITSRNKTEERSTTFNVETNGEYNFAIRAIADPGNELTLEYFEIENLSAMAAPNPATNLKATPGESGNLEATIGFTMPSETVGGDEITSNLSAEITRGDAVITTIGNLAPGSNCSYTDTEAAQGINVYSVVIIDSEQNRSVPSEISVRCGIDIPALPTNIRLHDEGSSIRLSWEHPTVGINGGYINPEELEYTIYDTSVMHTVIQDGVTGTEFTMPLGEISGQMSVALAIGVKNIAGTNPQLAVSNNVIAGNPTNLPIVEHFGSTVSDCQWFIDGYIINDEYGWHILQGNGAYGDPGYAYFTGSGTDNEEQSLISAKISLKGSKKPMLHFYYAAPDQQNSELQVQIATDYNGNYSTVHTVYLENETSQEWHECELPLSDYISADYIHVAFKAIPSKSSFFSTICLDEISIRDLNSHDLAAESIAIDLDNNETKVGETVPVTVTIQNIGSNTAEQGSYSIKLFAGDRCANTAVGNTIAPYAKERVTLLFSPASTDADIVKLRAEIAFDNDNDKSNNVIESDEEIWISKPMLPAVTDLSASVEGQIVHLTWSSPDLSGEPVMVRTDDFESYRPFNINSAGLWNIIDGDGVTISTVDFFPGYDKPIGFIVLNPGMVSRFENTLADTWPAHSGEQYMAAFSPLYGDNDDWLISPELSGNAQQIRFFACGGNESAGRERMEILTSTTGNDIASMTPFTTEPIMVDAGGWTEYAFDVPEGTLYFAIHCTSHDRMALLIDDFTYESAARPLEAKFNGYNVYCDNELMNDTPLAQTSYTGELSDGTIYTVRAVYDLGESANSNKVDIKTAGLQEKSAEKTVIAIKYYNLTGIAITKAKSGSFVIKQSFYSDGTSHAEKIFLKEDID